jgi:hypothetical protein
MRITRIALIVAGVALVFRGLAVVSAQEIVKSAKDITKYGVTVRTAKPAVLAKAKTYLWTISQPSPIKTVDAQIMAAVDREMSTLGFTKIASGKSDLLATYAAVRRTDADMKKATQGGAIEMYPVGTLVLDLRDPANNQPLWRVRIDKPIDTAPEKAEETINAAVAAMFEKYPTRVAPKR